ncbi:Hpt domain-containing protein [Ensifer soli]|uniref:Hpt domain-containing protein n=1 Tax=Ciceribacter sp. sgz301302 TaxID=3342379 RepID=UPI0035B74CFB
MAALKIAFEAPDNLPSSSMPRARPIDLVHLATQTMGDKALELEVLQIFARQSRQSMKEIGEGGSDQRLAAAHRLKGAARAVGAGDVARAAAAVEDAPESSAALAGLSAAVIEAELFILKLCR